MWDYSLLSIVVCAFLIVGTTGIFELLFITPTLLLLDI